MSNKISVPNAYSKIPSFHYNRTHQSSSRGKLGKGGGGVLVVSKELDLVVVVLGVVYVVVATHFNGRSVIVVRTPPGPGVPKVTVVQD